MKKIYIIISFIIFLSIVFYALKIYYSKREKQSQENIIVLEKKSKKVKKTDIPFIQEKINKIENNYGEYIKKASQICHVPEDLIVAFIYSESGGDPDIKSGAGAIGLMQLKKGSANDMIWNEYQLGRLSDKEIGELKKKLGNRFDCILSMKHLGDKLKCNHNRGYVITNKDLEDAEFNITAGTIYLGMLMDKYRVKDSIRLDRVKYHYRNGYSANNKSEHSVIASTHENAMSYILKME